MEYTKEYFIKKFNAIPDHQIGRGALYDHCALWHCGVRKSEGDSLWKPTEEAKALVKLFGGKVDDDYIEWRVVWRINDDKRASGATPKERILNKLKSL